MATIGREAARAPLTSADINDGIVTAADLASTLDLSSKTLTMPALSSLSVTGDLTVDTNTLYVDSTNNRVGVGTASPVTRLMLEHTNDGAVGGTIRIKDRDSQQDANQLTGAIEFESEDATTPTSGVSTAIKAFAASSSGGSYLTISTTDISTSTLDERARIDSSGNLLVGGTTAEAATSTTIYQSGQIVSRVDGTYATEFRRDTSDGDISVFKRGTTTVGSIGAEGGNLYIDGNAGTGKTGIEFSGAEWFPRDAGANSNGVVSLGDASNRFKDLYLSGGVVFGSTGGAVTSKTLDDYEEGTFTPTLVNGTVTYNQQQGFYTKTGRVVTINLLLSWGALSGSGSFTISGFPFLPLNTSYYRFTGALGYTFGVDFGGRQFLTITGNGGVSVMNLYANADNATPTIIDVSSCSSVGEIQVTTTYMTSS